MPMILLISMIKCYELQDMEENVDSINESSRDENDPLNKDIVDINRRKELSSSINKICNPEDFCVQCCFLSSSLSPTLWRATPS